MAKDLSLKTMQSQKGAVVLVISVVLLIAVTLVVFYAAQVGLQDQRISANQYRHKQAFSNAEAGLEYAASFLRENASLHSGNAADGWNSCAGNTTLFPCNIEDAEQVLGTISGGDITSDIPTLAGINSFLVKKADGATVAIGVGTSDDNTASSVVQASYAVRSIIVPGQLPPLMMPSGNLSGSFTVVPNPNGGGPGVPISIWSTDDALATATGSWQTCDHENYRDGGVCMDTKGDGETGANWQACSCTGFRSDKDNIGIDIVTYPTANFPSSPFVYVFGEEGDDPAALKTEIKSIAESEGLVLPNCGNLQTDFAGLTGSALVWVEGDCNINSNSIIGSRNKPIVLVVEGEVKTNGGAEVWGILVGLGTFSLNGGPVFHGSAIAEVDGELTNGTYDQVYDEDVFTNVTDSSVNDILTRVQYSWRDFEP
ncbi:MAG: hypothetical protein HUJ23_09200 [Methylophaga sp.]|nr:hypothetical protein [Methylophaga sp.]